MEKYLVFIKFEYSDVPDEFDDTIRFKKILVGTYDNQQDAKTCGNNKLKLFETKFGLKSTCIAERFEDNYFIIDEYNIFIDNYLNMPFNCNIQIELIYDDDVENTINDIFESIKNFNNYNIYNE